MKTFHIAMKYAEKHNENAPARGCGLPGRWMKLGINRGGGRLHRRP